MRLYAQLEAGVAVLGVLSTLALARSAPLFVALQDTVGPLAWALPFGLVGVPAFLMGGTLPALLRSLHPDADAVAPADGRPLRGQHRRRGRGHARDAVSCSCPPSASRARACSPAALGLAVAAAALVLDRRVPRRTRG